MSCGGGGLRMSLCPDTRVNTDQELLLDRLASSHVYHSAATSGGLLHTHEVMASGKDRFTHFTAGTHTKHERLTCFILIKHKVDKVKYVIICLSQDVGSFQ